MFVLHRIQVAAALLPLSCMPFVLNQMAPASVTECKPPPDFIASLFSRLLGWNTVRLR